MSDTQAHELRGTVVVAAAQSTSRRGDIERNVADHLRYVEAAARAGADLVVFPELSLTGYELDLAAGLALALDDARLVALGDAAGRHGLTIVAGAPWATGRGKPRLGAFVFEPGRTSGYAKIHVHASEADHFIAGESGAVLPVAGLVTGLAICADTGFPSHAEAVAGRGAELYAASVFVTPEDHARQVARFEERTRRHNMAALMANYASPTGGQATAGRSAFWDERGRVVAEADAAGEALVVARREHGRWSAHVLRDLDG